MSAEDFVKLCETGHITDDYLKNRYRKKINCPQCGKELIRLESYEDGVYSYWCDDCNIDIKIINNKEKESN